MSRFTKEQPKDGDTILHCGHLDAGAQEQRWRGFKYEEVLRFSRPDGTHGAAEWFAACDACFVRHGAQVAAFARGDGRWTGDAPAVQKVKSC